MSVPIRFPGRAATAGPPRDRRRPRLRPEVTTLEARNLLTVSPIQPSLPTTVVANPPVLWPPNGRIQSVVISGTVADIPGGGGINPASFSYRVIDEYGTLSQGAPPLGAIPVAAAPGAQVAVAPGGAFAAFAFAIPVQVSRHGFDRDGRQYTVIVADADVMGNLGVGATVVTIPHDLGHGFGPAGPISHGGRGHGPGGPHGPRGHNGRPFATPARHEPVIVPVFNPNPGHGGHGNGGQHGNGHGQGHGNGHGHGHGKS